MRIHDLRLRRAALALVIGASLAASSCKGEPSPPASNAAPAAAGAATTAPVAALLKPTDETWTPEALEDLLAPVALYPDPVLGEVLVASTNPQEILDAGNWRLQNENLEGKELDAAAEQVGFTAPVRVLLQNPVVLDMMSSKLGWTTEVGQAYVNDQAGVLDAVQRLRLQAVDAGNLATSDKMVVTNDVYEGERYVALSSPDPEVVYVPQYDPEAAYAPAESSGHSTGTLVATALLAFGAGVLVGKIFDRHDDDWYYDDYYAPRYYGRPMPYYPAYPYRPVYGGRFTQSTVYVRPTTYRYAYTNTTIVRRDGDTYWNRYDDRTYTRRETRTVVSPITRARPNRPELAKLNEDARRGPKRRFADERPDRDTVTDAKRDGRDRPDKAGQPGDRRRDADVDRDRADKRGGGGKDNRPKAGGGGRGGDRPKAGGGGRGDRPKAGGGGGGDRPKAGGGGGGGRPKAGGGGNRGGGGGRRRG
jgi:hypothetical protein